MVIPSAAAQVRGTRTPRKCVLIVWEPLNVSHLKYTRQVILCHEVFNERSKWLPLKVKLRNSKFPYWSLNGQFHFNCDIAFLVRLCAICLVKLKRGCGPS